MGPGSGSGSGSGMETEGGAGEVGGAADVPSVPVPQLAASSRAASVQIRVSSTSEVRRPYPMRPGERAYSAIATRRGRARSRRTHPGPAHRLDDADRVATPAEPGEGRPLLLGEPRPFLGIEQARALTGRSSLADGRARRHDRAGLLGGDARVWHGLRDQSQAVRNAGGLTAHDAQSYAAPIGSRQSWREARADWNKSSSFSR